MEPTELSEDHTCQKAKFHWLYPQKHWRRLELMDEIARNTGTVQYGQGAKAA
jgi:hypothetical protein